jgi:hypothetical protein
MKFNESTDSYEALVGIDLQSQELNYVLEVIARHLPIEYQDVVEYIRDKISEFPKTEQGFEGAWKLIDGAGQSEALLGAVIGAARKCFAVISSLGVDAFSSHLTAGEWKIMLNNMDQLKANFGAMTTKLSSKEYFTTTAPAEAARARLAHSIEVAAATHPLNKIMRIEIIHAPTKVRVKASLSLQRAFGKAAKKANAKSSIAEYRLTLLKAFRAAGSNEDYVFPKD